MEFSKVKVLNLETFYSKQNIVKIKIKVTNRDRTHWTSDENDYKVYLKVYPRTISLSCKLINARQDGRCSHEKYLLPPFFANM